MEMDTLDKAIDFHQSGKLSEAESLYRRIISESPKNADAWHLLGLLASQMGKSLIAITLIEHAISIDASVPIYYNSLGAAHGKNGDSIQEEQYYKKALEQSPELVSAKKNLSMLLKKQGRMDEYDALTRTKDRA